ncbi:MAG: anti-sigma factor, partial [Pseudomonadota bacterium]
DQQRFSQWIRTSVADADEKVPEIWLIPDQGDRKGEVLSLGVMDENAPDVVQITEEFLPLIGEGGTLAITMEPPGGAPVAASVLTLPSTVTPVRLKEDPASVVSDPRNRSANSTASNETSVPTSTAPKSKFMISPF